jgi:hypothetical protein
LEFQYCRLTSRKFRSKIHGVTDSFGTFQDDYLLDNQMPGESNEIGLYGCFSETKYEGEADGVRRSPTVTRIANAGESNPSTP